jgi:hypothetical protein
MNIRPPPLFRKNASSNPIVIVTCMGETFVWIAGTWMYLFRAVNSQGGRGGNEVGRGLPDVTQPGSGMMETPEVLLEHHLKTFCRRSFVSTTRLRSSVPRSASVFRANLFRLMELELIDRRATEPRIHQAKFDGVKTLDSFDFLAIPSLNMLGRKNWIHVGSQHAGRRWRQFCL